MCGHVGPYNGLTRAPSGAGPQREDSPIDTSPLDRLPINGPTGGLTSRALLAVASLVLASCSAEEGLPIGATCVSDSQCNTRLCYANQCLQPDADDDGDGLTNAEEQRLGTNPVSSDTDSDGEEDKAEVGPNLSSPKDSDGDGKIDAIESGTADADGDCIKDELDADDANKATDLDLIKQKGCRLAGVCAPYAEAITAECQDSVLSCDYSAAPSYEGAVETLCDGADGDCDGQTDEDFVINGEGPGGECQAGPDCGTGVVQCSLDQTRVVCSSSGGGAGGVEVCDGKDNDCDGDIDEDVMLDGVPVGGPCVGRGACANAPGVVECNLSEGAPVCSVGAGGSTSLAVEEVCDGIDNDCDGTVDEGLVYMGKDGLDHPKSTPCGLGACAGGVVVCGPQTGLATCSTLILSAPEICDGVDNDCDGETDEGMSFLGTPLGKPCEGLGECGVGIVECVPTTGLATCSTHANGTQSQAQIEVCDGLDNDCDGLVDDALLYEGVPLGGQCKGRGECGTGTVECVPLGLPVCSTNPDGSESGAQPESCDGLDNDCDGETDEDVEVAPADCDAKGICAALVTATCTGGQWLCELPQGAPGYEPEGETSCDGQDNDCDGATDEGLPMSFGAEWAALDEPEPTEGPGDRAGAQLAVDEAGGALYVFGGYRSMGEESELLRDVWRLDLQTATWTLLAEDGGPSSEGTAMEWDATSARLLIYGVLPAAGDTPPTGALWAIHPDQGAWESLQEPPLAPPPAASGATLTQDPATGVLYRVGGHMGDGTPGGFFALDPKTLSWSPMAANDAGPALLAGHTAAWDTGSGRLVVIGGATAAAKGSPTVYAIVPGATVWTKVTVLPGSGDAPRPSLLIDGASHRALVAAGADLFDVSLDDGEGVELVFSQAQDAALIGAVGFYDSARRRGVLYGGLAPEGDTVGTIRVLLSECKGNGWK